MVMSAVSSVSTPGVLVTVRPRVSAVCTSILSTPLPKLAISFRFSPVWARSWASILSVTVGTSTSAVRSASASSAWVMGWSSTLSRASKSSRIRVSTTSGSLRVTTTSGFFLLMTGLTPSLDTRPRTRRMHGLSLSVNRLDPRTWGHTVTVRWRVGLLYRCGLRKTISAQPPPSDETRDRLSMPHAPRRAPAILALLALLALAPTGVSVARAAEPVSIGPVSKLPVPRFVSLKSDRVNLREGPSKEHRTSWVFQRSGLPVEITAEFETWRRIRDSEGSEGWVLHSLLSARRDSPGSAVVEGRGTTSLREVEYLFGSIGPVATRRAGFGQGLRWHVVPAYRSRLRRLHAAGEALGRLSEREGRVIAAARPTGCMAPLRLRGRVQDCVTRSAKLSRLVP